MKLFRKKNILFCLYIHLLCFSSGDYVSIPCARFRFPTLSTNTVTGEVNSTITFPFKLERTDTHCDALDDFVLTVAKTDGTSQTRQHYCMILHKNGICQHSSLPSGCKCLEEKGQFEYQFSKEDVDMTDSTEWVWTTNKGLAEEEKIAFDITTPPSVTRLSLSGHEDELPHPLPHDSPLEVVCLWKNGDPPTTARLLDRRGKVLASSSDSSGQIRYKFDEVGCQDAGVIHCEAPGASHNKTARVLVRCAPSFEGRDVKEFELKAGQTSELRFQVRMHSTDVRKCQLYMMTSPTPGGPQVTRNNRDCAGDLSGTPPDLTLSVVFESPKEEDDGHWRVEMINDIGPDILDFYLDIVSGPENKTRAVPDVAVASSAGGVNMIAIAGVNVTTVVVVVIIVLIIVSVRRSRRESRSHQDPERLDVQVAFQPGPAAAERDNEDDQNSNPYDVVQGVPVEEPKQYMALNPPASQKQEAEGNDYLQPVPPKQSAMQE